MGEYAIFVWPCYIVTVALLTVLCFSSWKNKNDDEKKLEELKNQMNELTKQD